MRLQALKVSLIAAAVLFSSIAMATGDLASIYTDEAMKSMSLPPGSGRASGLLGVIIVKADALQKTLPKGLTLAPELIQPDGTFPAAMFIGLQEELSVELNGHKVLIEDEYREATLSFSVVGPTSKTARYNYTSKIVVDSVKSMLMGWALGYPKRLVTASSTSDGFHAEFSKKKPVIDVVMVAPETYDAEVFAKNLAFLASQVQPSIGKTPFGFMCFDFDWNFAQAKASPVSAKIDFHEGFAGKALAATYTAPSLDQHPFGALRIESQWKMSGFRKCD